MANPDSTATVLVERLRAEQARLTRLLLAPNTQRGYRFDWAAFARWCEEMNCEALPASCDTVGLYVTHQLSLGRKVSTVKRRVCAIAHAHRTQGLPPPVSPEVLILLRAARRDHARVETVRRVCALTIEELRAIAVSLAADHRPIAIRDRAVIVTGFASALRSASLASLTLADVRHEDRGAVLRIIRSKTDQQGEGREIGLPHGKHPETCPVRCLREWIEMRGALPGDPGRPLFTRFESLHKRHVPLEPERICQIVQNAVRRIGLDPSRIFGSHSLRASFVTAAVDADIDELLIMRQTCHRDRRSLAQYFRERDVFRSNVAGMLDL